MRSLLCLSALLPALAVIASCDSDQDPSSESSGIATSSGAEETGSSVGSSTTSAETAGTSTTLPSSATDPMSTTNVTGDTESGTTTSAEGTTEGSGVTGEPDAPPPPTGAAMLLPWLEAGSYTEWEAEAERHPSLGPHFDGVRAFVNAALLESLEAGSDDHPVGAAVVKELFGPAPEVGGWAVMVKVAPGSSVDNWYWYESFEGTTYADDTGIDGCGNCHGLGSDFVRTTLPL